MPSQKTWLGVNVEVIDTPEGPPGCVKAFTFADPASGEVHIVPMPQAIVDFVIARLQGIVIAQSIPDMQNGGRPQG